MISLTIRLKKYLQRERLLPGATMLVPLLIFTMSVTTENANQWSKTLGLALLSPLQLSSDRVAGKVASLFTWVRSVHDLREENILLRAHVDRLSTEIHGLREASHENETLRGLLGCRERLPFETISAEVIGRDPSHWFRSIIVDQGTRHGVRPHMPVITAQGLVGVVTDVSPFSSRIRMLLDPEIRVGVLIQETRAEAILEGRLLHGCELRYLAKDTSVAADAAVVTSGLGGIYPRGIPVGRIIRVIDNDEELYLRAEVMPSVDLSHIERVLIVGNLTEGPSEPDPSPAEDRDSA